MEILELQLRVSGHPSLEQDTKEDVMNEETFEPLPHSSQIRLLGQVAPESWLAAQVQNSAVFISQDWTVSIHGKNLINCVAAMSVLISSVGQELRAPVGVSLISHPSNRVEPLHLVLKRVDRRERIWGVIKWGATILISAGVGALIQWLIFGGRL